MSKYVLIPDSFKGTLSSADICRIAAEEILRELLQKKSCLQLKDLAINGHDLLARGYAGREVGAALQSLLQMVIGGEIENSREALLSALPEKK